MRRAQAQYITFPVYDSTAPTTLKTGVTFDAGDFKIKREASAAASTGAVPAETDLPGIYGFLATAAELNAAWWCLKGTHAGCVPVVLVGGLGEQPVYAVVDHADNSATTFLTDLPTESDNARKGGYVRFQTGALAGQVRKVYAHTGATKFLAFAVGFTAEPAAGDLFAFVN